ncbi:hypothetical protein TorRG33x02_004600, partial [Trema orientale]
PSHFNHTQTSSLARNENPSPPLRLSTIFRQRLIPVSIFQNFGPFCNKILVY